MGDGPLTLLWAYYEAAMLRAFWSGLGWAINQGILLTVLVTVCTAFSEGRRFISRRRQGGDRRMKAVTDFAKEAAVVVAVRWPRLSEQNFRVDKWNVCRV